MTPAGGKILRAVTPLLAGSIITTGSFTGMAFPDRACRVTGKIAGLPGVSLVLT